jgi:hypothetical protein
MLIKDRSNEGTRLGGGMPAHDKVHTAKGSASNDVDRMEYRDSPKMQKKLMRELEEKTKRGIPRDCNAGNK